MNLYDIPGLGGIKTLLEGYGLLIIGVAKTLAALAVLLMAVGHRILGEVPLAECARQLPDLFQALVISFAGLGILGIGHKAQKIIENTQP